MMLSKKDAKRAVISLRNAAESQLKGCWIFWGLSDLEDAYFCAVLSGKHIDGEHAVIAALLLADMIEAGDAP